MEAATGIAGPWKLAGAVGTLAAGAITAMVDVQRPDLGLSTLCVEGHAIAGRLFCVKRELVDEVGRSPFKNRADGWPLAVKEVYARNADLVASFNAEEDWPYSPQIYWSSAALDSLDGVIGSLSLLVSVQTHLLDTWPRIAAESWIACDEILQVDVGGDGAGRAKYVATNAAIRCPGESCCIVRRWNDAQLSYAEIMLTNDFREASLACDAPGGDSLLKWTLFSEFMEKGVIRRARLVGAFLRREHDVELAAKCCRAVECSPLPLTV
jgi:hypothetical protein